MGNLIGSIVPVQDPEHPDEIDSKEVLRKQRAWNKVFYEEIVDPLGDRAEFAEIDVILVTNADSEVIAYNTVRVSVDEPDDHGILFGDVNAPVDEWVRSLIEWAHEQEGMVYIHWMHVHPEGAPLPGSKDQFNARVATAMDLITTGHLGSQRHFQALSVLQRAGQVVVQGDIEAISPKIDAEVSRVYSRTYARVLGEDHPLTVAQQEMTDKLEAFVAQGDSDNPLAMIAFVMGSMLDPDGGIRGITERMEAAKATIVDEELRALVQADYPVWLAEGKPDTTGGQRPFKALTERLTLPDEDGAVELPGFLLDALSGFDFTGLDPQ